jgi:hypothetical protein
MKLKNIMGTMTLSAAILVSSFSITPLTKVKAEGNLAQIENIKEYIQQTKDTKTFGIYNTAYKFILELPEAERAPYLEQLSLYAQEVYTPLNLEIINKLSAFSKDANLGDYEALIVDINSKVKDPIDNGYFLGELTSWGKQLVYTPEVIKSIDSIIDAYSKKTLESVNIAKTNIEKVNIPKSRKWLYEQLIQIASQLGDLIIISFE